MSRRMTETMVMEDIGAYDPDDEFADDCICQHQSSDHEDYPPASELFKERVTQMMSSFNNYWQESDFNDEEVRKSLLINDGLLTKTEWQEIMAEANQKIRSLQFTASQQKNHLNDYMTQIDQLVAEQEKIRRTHRTEISLVKNQTDYDRVSMMEQIQNLKKLRDDMTKRFHLTESQTNDLMKEKEALQSELHEFRRRSSLSQAEDMNENKKDFGNTDLNYWKQKALAFEAAVNNLRVKYEREFKQRRKLYNELQDLKGNIRVFARCRPLLQNEIDQNAMEIVGFPDDECISVINKQDQTERFRFDKVFDKHADNKEVYRETAPYIQSVLDGYNVTIFAYGQTGSGKTFTMTAVDNNALNDLFRLQKKQESEWLFETNVSMLEIYNEQIVDLLDEVPDELDEEVVPPKECKIRCKEIRKGKFEIYVENLLRLPVEELKDVLELMELGTTHRTVAETKMNTESSRSHLLTIVYITATNRTTGLKMKGKLNLIDLAGSERVKKSGVDGMRLKEAANINRSLSALGDVIDALCRKQKHIPYRNSKLTFILQDSLGQSAKTLMFINVSPADIHCQETITSLRFAQRAKKVELGKAVKNK